MLYLAVLILLTLFLYLELRKKLYRGLKIQAINYEDLRQQYENLTEENTGIKKVSSLLEQTAEETIALYDITKDICRTLNEDKIFSIFYESIKRYIKIGDCRFIREEIELLKYKKYAVLPLIIHNNKIGYLVADGVKTEDQDKFHILAQQFLLGLKRALLYQKVQELTITDSLTQVFNRRYFIERFNEEFKRSEKFKLKFSFLMVDIDHFKDYNDHYGHLVGDAILREIARAIKENIRQIDFMGRYGGEELSIILAETDKEQASPAAERIRQAIESRRITVYDEDLHVTISIGFSTFPEDATGIQGIIEKADQALYLAKQTGRNKVCMYEPHK